MKRASARRARTMSTVMGVAGNEESKGGKVMAMAMATRIAGKWTATAPKSDGDGNKGGG